MPADSNGKPDREQGPAPPEERTEILDRHADTTRPRAGTMICMDIGCWRPAEESWEQFVARALRP